MQYIDAFNHFFPKRLWDKMMASEGAARDIGKRMRGIPMLADLDVRFRVMDAFDGYEQVLSLPTPPIEVFSRGNDAIDLARAANDGMAELVRRASGQRLAS